MTAFHGGRSGAGYSPYTAYFEPGWFRTPWWCFWRPKWMRYIGGPDNWNYEFATDKQLARWYLEREFTCRQSAQWVR